jgi:hypothetical protein
MEVLAPSLSVVEKIELKDEKNLLIQGLPSTIEKQFAKLSFAKNVTPLLKVRKIDFALIFAINHNQLKDILKDVVPALHADAKLWVAYPKVSSKIVSDLSRDCNWQCISQFGLNCERLIALDNVWCAMRFKKTNDVPAPLLSIEPQEECIDFSSRSVTPPPALASLFEKNKKARSFFETLSFTNQKEYVVWINSARKVETKQARLDATIEKLNIGKRNPSDK